MQANKPAPDRYCPKANSHTRYNNNNAYVIITIWFYIDQTAYRLLYYEMRLNGGGTWGS